MTFDELVTRVQNYLDVSNKPPIASTEEVGAVLAESGVEELVHRNRQLLDRTRLLVREIRIRGHKWRPGQNRTPFIYSRKLSTGLNGWVAGNGAGKSTVLNAILWGVTGVKPRFKADVVSWIEDVAVEIELGDGEFYVIRYYPNSPGIGSVVKGAIFKGSLDSVVNDTDVIQIEGFEGPGPMKDAIGRFLANKLGFSALESIRQAPHSINLKYESIAWDVFSQVMHIGADDLSDYLFPLRELREHHEKTLGMYLGLDLIEAINRMNSVLVETRNQYQFEIRQVEESATKTHEAISALEAELKDLEEKIQQVDRGDSILTEPDRANRVRQRFAEGIEAKSRLDEQLRGLEAEAKRKQDHIDQLDATGQSLREAIQFKVFLSGLPVVKCPHCENELDPARIEDEVASKICHVCGNTLKPITAVDEQMAMLKAAEVDRDRTKKELKQLRADIKHTVEDIGTATRTLTQVEKEYRDLSRQAVSGFTDEMRRLLDRRGYVRGQLDRLQERTREHQKDRLNYLLVKQNTLLAALKILRSDMVQTDDAMFSKLRHSTLELAQSFGLPNCEEVNLDRQLHMFVKQSGRNVRFNDLKPSEALRVKVAFHLALLLARTRDDVGRHPGFLVIDAPGSGEIDDEHFTAMLSGLATTTRSLGNQVQVLVASARDELANWCDKDKLEYKTVGVPLF